jgi:hypothetical protein
MASRDDAEQALYGAIVKAAGAAEDSKDGDLLKSAAEAFREVAHGPSGGDYHHSRIASDTSTSTSKSEQSYRGDTHYDYHETHHRDGEDRPALGFRENP